MEGGWCSMRRQEVARPLHLQRLEAALDVRPLVAQVEQLLARSQPSDSDEEPSPGELARGDRVMHGVVTTKQERRSDRRRLLNLSSVGAEREWLGRLLLSSSGSESSDDDSPAGRDARVRQLLAHHVMHKKYAADVKDASALSRYMYYGAGLLSTVDRYPERRVSRAPAPGPVRVRKPRSDRPGPQPRGRKPKALLNKQAASSETGDWESRLNSIKQECNLVIDEAADYNSKAAIRARKKAGVGRSPEALSARRRRHWQLMAKKELGKVQRARAQQHRELAQQRRRLANLCCKQWRAKAMQSQKNMKETVWRCKRLSREMQAYWRRYERAERESRRRMEKEAEEQRKMDVEMMEAKRQRRKLNFLITQTELYAHFMQRKLPTHSDPDTQHILQQLDDTTLAPHDTYDSEEMKAKACHNAQEAFQTDRARMQMFDSAAGAVGVAPPPAGDYDQPSIFRGTLKGYQLKGMNWLANLYDQGISGILADEMGLGKTVQCIAFLCHVAERLGVWGPFLVVSPASTLHNWQQELQRFVPDFKVVPYWGSPSERRILRQFWERRDLHTRSAAFHVVVTSYQIVVSDLKYLNRVSWQYMILDEAQAIKSSASMRWKLLLGFSCRNRLLLSGTPIQNSMAELWALLHFIMPTLFDSHHEFNEWFSKDIESHAENKTAIDEKHLSRLHMILKPFMLRRIKRDVENELSDKIEIMVHCPLTIRQKLLYHALKKKIRVEDLLHYSGEGAGGEKGITSSLLNLVMQFRKVCNHPELFERRDVRSPLALRCEDYSVPRLVAERGVLQYALPSRARLLYNLLSPHVPAHVHAHAAFSFTRLIDLSPMEWYRIYLCEWLWLMKHMEERHEKFERLRHRRRWWETDGPGRSEHERVLSKDLLWICPGGDTLASNKHDSPLWRALLFTDRVPSPGGVFYAHVDHTIHYTSESVEHRAMRQRHALGLSRDHDQSVELLQEIKTEEGGMTSIKQEPTEMEEFEHVEREAIVRRQEPTCLPAFLYQPVCKVVCAPRSWYAVSRRFEHARARHALCETREARDTLASLCATATVAASACIHVPDKNQLVSDAGKLTVLDSLLKRLKERGHRVLIYSQMTKMIDILEEYMWHRKHKYMRLDGSSKISARRDMVADFQARADMFVFLLSTRAGGLGINLTAADTVIFYDSDWNPTVDQQAMDRAHRLGQTKQVTVYRLICKGTIEERIMERAREKSEIQRMVISGGSLTRDSLKPTEVVSLLLDDEEIERKYRVRSAERRMAEERGSKRKPPPPPRAEPEPAESAEEAEETPLPLSGWGTWRRATASRRGRPRGARNRNTTTRHDTADVAATECPTMQYDELDVTELVVESSEPAESGAGAGAGGKGRRGGRRHKTKRPPPAPFTLN